MFISPSSPQNEELKKAFLLIFNAYQEVLLKGNNIERETKLYNSIFSILPTLSYFVNDFKFTTFGTKEVKFIKEVIKYVSNHYSEPISITELCNTLSYSKTSLYRMFEI